MKKLCSVVAVMLFLTAVSGEIFTHDVKTEKKPWTHERFLNQDGEFSFVILPDRTGGERKKGIWAGALDKANMFHPDFIITTGDMIEGINKPEKLKKENMEAQFAELRSITGKSVAPFFYLVGNHDISRTRPGFPMVNEMGKKIWLDHLGTTYYSFLYKNVLFLCLDQMEGRDSRPKQCGLTDTQLAWALETLKKYPDVRWTLVFVHSPWTWNEAPFRRLEKAMADRNYTVFSGDFHYYNKFSRYGRDYYLLATAGGTSKMRGIKDWGEFDHITYVTMTVEGPQVVNILLDGILPGDVVTTKQSKQSKTHVVKDIPVSSAKK